MRSEGLEVVTVQPRVLAREGICVGISASLSHLLATQICSGFNLEAFPNYMPVSERSPPGGMTPARAAPPGIHVSSGKNWPQL